MQPLTSLRESNSMVVGIAPQEKQCSVADIVGQTEVKDPLEELLGWTRVLAFEHRVAELPWLDAAAGMPGLVARHSGEDFENVARGTEEPDRVFDAELSGPL